MTTTTLPTGTYGPQTISSGETLISTGGPSETTITSAAGTNGFVEYFTASNVQIGNLSGGGFTISDTLPGGYVLTPAGSNVTIEGNILSADGGAGADLVTQSGADNLLIEGNQFEGTGFALAYVNGYTDGGVSTSVNFINNTFSGTATAGADLADDASSGTISGNTFTGSGQQAIFLGTASTAAVNYLIAAYGPYWTPNSFVPGSVTVTGNNFSG